MPKTRYNWANIKLTEEQQRLAIEMMKPARAYLYRHFPQLILHPHTIDEIVHIAAVKAAATYSESKRQRLDAFGPGVWVCQWVRSGLRDNKKALALRLKPLSSCLLDKDKNSVVDRSERVDVTACIRADAAEVLANLRKTLPKKYLRIYIMRRVENMTIKAIGKMFGVSSQRIDQLVGKIEERIRCQEWYKRMSESWKH